MMKLKAFRQEQPHTCLVACIRIVLEYRGRTHGEQELAEACKSVPMWGTLPADAVAGLEQLGYRALWFENASLERLMALLNQDWPVIVFLRAADLPHGRAGLHSVVVAGLDKGDVICLDPTLGAELRLDLNDFVQAWSALDNQGMVLWIP
jgi:ABC-type bacteriocin/lantibiotic exporter with double-glycine peptidase domain